MGVSEPVVREYWQDSLYSPLTFEELSYVAYERRFKGLVKNINEGHPEKNEEFFRRRFFDIRECKGAPEFVKQCCDNKVLEIVAGKYKYKLEQEEIDEINKAISESVRPLEPEKSLWDKMFGRTKIFESDEWKNRKQYIKD